MQLLFSLSSFVKIERTKFKLEKKIWKTEKYQKLSEQVLEKKIPKTEVWNWGRELSKRKRWGIERDEGMREREFEIGLGISEREWEREWE